MERLQEITANASFASHVTQLIYDARLFVPRFTSFAARKMFYNEPQLYLSRVSLDRSVYRSHAIEQNRDSKHRYNGFHPSLSSLCSERDAVTERHHKELAESLFRYTGFFDEQQHIFDGGQDLQCLRAGIEKLPKLTKVSIANFKGYDTVLSNDKHRWYQDQARKGFDCAVEPLWYCQERGNYDGVDCYPWDCRGLQNLILAISTCKSVKELRIGFDFPNDLLELDVLIAQRLTSLDCNLRIFSEDLVGGGVSKTLALKRVLEETKNLQNLEINWIACISTVQGLYWPHLKSLSLVAEKFAVAEFMTLAQAYRKTLRYIAFRDLFCTNQPWLALAKNLG